MPTTVIRLIIATVLKETTGHAGVWRRRIALARWCINGLRWAEDLLPAMLIFLIPAAGFLYALRATGLNGAAAAMAVALAVVAAGWFALRRSRAHFLSTAQVTILLETRLGLGAALSAAATGRCYWPTAANHRLGDCFHLRPLPLHLLPFAAVAIVLVAWFIPVPDSAAAPHAGATVTPPWSWLQAEALLEAIEAEAIVESGNLETFRQQLDSLFGRPADEWFSHSSLEIGDSLNDTLRSGLDGLSRDLGAAAALLDQARRLPETGNREMAEHLQRGLAEAIQRLELGTLPPREDLLSALRDLDPSAIRQLSAEDWQNLQQQLDNCRSNCATLAGEGEQGHALASIPVVADAEFAPLHLEAGMDFSSDPNQQTPLTLRPDATEGTTGRREGLPAADHLTGPPLDSSGVRIGEHRDEEPEFRPLYDQAGQQTGSGGEAVWRNRLTPEERRRLDSYFQ